MVAFVDLCAVREPWLMRPDYFSFLYSYYDHGRTAPLDTDRLDSPEKRAALRGRIIFLIAFEVPQDPIKDAFLHEYHLLTTRHFPGYGHLGITVYILK